MKAQITTSPAKFGYWVAYHIYSSCGGCRDTEQEAIAECKRMIQYYKDLDYVIRSATIQQLCPHCESGKVKTVFKRKMPVYKECKHCNGNGVINEYTID